MIINFLSCISAGVLIWTKKLDLKAKIEVICMGWTCQVLTSCTKVAVFYTFPKNTSLWSPFFRTQILGPSWVLGSPLLCFWSNTEGDVTRAPPTSVLWQVICLGAVVNWNLTDNGSEEMETHGGVWADTKLSVIISHCLHSICSPFPVLNTLVIPSHPNPAKQLSVCLS